MTGGGGTGASITLAGLVADASGGMTFAGNAVTTVTGASTYTGPTVISGGTLTAGVASVANVSGALGDNSAVSLANSAGVVLNLNGNNTQVGSLTGGGAAGGNVVLGSATLTVGGNNTSPAAYAGAISGAGSLDKIGTGTFTLSGTANGFTGGTTIASGVLQLGSSLALGNSSSTRSVAVTVSGGTLDLHGVSPAIDLLSGGTGAVDDLASSASTLTLGSYNGSSTYSGAIQSTSGAVSLVKTGTGAFDLTGTNTYSGITKVTGGTLQFATPASLYYGGSGSWTSANITGGSGATLTVNVGGTSDFSPTQAGTLLTNLTGTNSGLLAGSTFGFDTTNATAPVVFPSAIQNSGGGTAAVGIAKFGPGTLYLANASNSYGGPTTVNAGELVLQGQNSGTGLVTVKNSTPGALSVLSLQNGGAWEAVPRTPDWPRST